MPYSQRLDLGGTAPAGLGQSLLSVLHLSDAHVIDTVSPARCEWVELLGHDPRWAPLLHMHRPYEALTHWTLAAHVDRARRLGAAPASDRPFDLAISTGDNIDNAQHNELDTYLRIMAGGTTRMTAVGGVHQPSAELGPGPWPFWCPDAAVLDTWKPLGYAAVADFVARASAEVHSQGFGFAWASLPGNHDFMRQGTALLNPAIEAIAVGSGKTLTRPPGLSPDDVLTRFVQNPAAFSAGATRQIQADPARAGVDRRAWVAAHVAHGAAGLGAQHVLHGSTDTCIDTEHARIILLDTNHPGGDFEGSLGASQLAWLEDRLAEVETQRGGRFAVICSHHGSVSLTNTLGDDPERRHKAELMALVHRHPCVVAWLVGHRHLHRITPQPGPSGGFWEITTGSLIDWPCQARTVEFVRHGDASMEIVCTLQDHEAAPDSLAGLHLAMARRFAGRAAAYMQGQPIDGNVRLIRP
jgi:metallophosphoesterase (TIGR03767 family)